jgi:hypothetical protein
MNLIRATALQPQGPLLYLGHTPIRIHIQTAYTKPIGFDTDALQLQGPLATCVLVCLSPYLDNPATRTPQRLSHASHPAAELLEGREAHPEPRRRLAQRRAERGPNLPRISEITPPSILQSLASLPNRSESAEGRYARIRRC